MEPILEDTVDDLTFEDIDLSSDDLYFGNLDISKLSGDDIFGKVEKKWNKTCIKTILAITVVLIIIAGVIVCVLALFCLATSSGNWCVCNIIHNCDYSHSNPVNKMRCSVTGSNTRGYPLNMFVYGIDFNTSISQANYVFYISTSGGNSVKKGFRKDPYDINPLRTVDYTFLSYMGNSYERGHLVPNADYGYDTFIISNAVPMLDKFNKGVWKSSEAYIRKKYSNKLVYKGCDYSGAYVMSRYNNKLYIPAGCYYMIFDSSIMPSTSQEYTLLEYGYYKNVAAAVKECKLPEWAKCHGFDSSTCI